MKSDNKQPKQNVNDISSHKPAGNKPRPEIRDNMDSRHSKPVNYKGDNSHKNDKARQTEK
jgi:hypothetical protein